MRSGGGVAEAKSRTEWGDTEGTCFIDSRMPHEDTQLKWYWRMERWAAGWITGAALWGRRRRRKREPRRTAGCEVKGWGWRRRPHSRTASEAKKVVRLAGCSCQRTLTGLVIWHNPFFSGSLASSTFLWPSTLPCAFISFCSAAFSDFLSSPCLFIVSVRKTRTPNSKTALWNFTHLQPTGGISNLITAKLSVVLTGRYKAVNWNYC